MRIVKPSIEITFYMPEDGTTPEQAIELAGRTCYKSEKRITKDSSQRFVRMLRDRGHEAMLEFGYATARIIADRGLTHELVRHRIASFAQESTRYVRYAKKRKDVFSDSDVVEAYLSGLSMRTVSQLSKGRYTEWEVYKILSHEDVPRRSAGNTGLVNDSFFETIDTVEKAYLLGFIFADGSLREASKQIGITQHQRSSWYLIQMIREFIKDNVSYWRDRDCYQIAWSSDKMFSDLVSKGVVPNKTYEASEKECSSLWESVPSGLKCDFLRGLLDGDGNVRFYVQDNPGKTKSFRLDWNALEPLLKHVVRWLEVSYDYCSSVKPLKETDRLCRTTVTGHAMGLRLCADLYGNFRFPFGHPKTARVFGPLGLNRPIPFTKFGNENFGVIEQPGIDGELLWPWAQGIKASEDAYGGLIELGVKPEIARSVLPIGLKTEIVIGANLREWRHVFSLRCAKSAHPIIRGVMLQALEKFAEKMPALYEDLAKEFL